MPDNLPELRDIHIPDGVSIFPLAYGWWVIALIIVGVIGAVYLTMFLRRKSKKLYALYLLKNLTLESPIKAAALMSKILRRICVYKYHEGVGLSGDDWAEFLLAHTKEKLSNRGRALLLDAPYMPEDAKDFTAEDAKDLRLFCFAWIGENL